jgi:hypothetical protein
MFGLGAVVALLLALPPTVAFVAAALDRHETASLVVLSGIALCLIGLASFLFMLGLIAEGVLHAQRETDPLDRLIVREVRP